MPDTSHYTSLPVPIDGEASDGPADFFAFRAALGGHTVLYATTAANRDALYAAAPVGTVCVSTSSKAVWYKTALPNVWDTIYADTGWVSLSSADWGADFSDAGSQYRVRNSTCFLRVYATYNGSTLNVGPGFANFADELVFTLPVAARPIFNAFSTGDVAGVTTVTTIARSSGATLMTSSIAGTTIETGQALQSLLTYAVN